MMFAGGGLALSMIVTTVWISGDVTRMREQEAAKRAAECAAAVAAAGPTNGADGSSMTAIDPTTGEPVGQAQQAPTDCPPATGTDAGTQQLDPNTGLPLDPAAGQAIDPATGLPMDPSAGTSNEFTDPSAGSYDDGTGAYGDGMGTGYDDGTGAGYDDAQGGTTYQPEGGDASYGADVGVDPVTGQPLDPAGYSTDPVPSGY